MAIEVSVVKKPDGYFANHPYWRGFCHPDDLYIESNYRRTYNQATLEELAADIAGKGLCNEIMAVLTGERLVVLDGHRRAKSIKLALCDPAEYPLGEHVSLTRVNVKVFTGPFIQEDILKIQISANLHENPRAEEEAEALYALWVKAQALGWSMTRFARECGKSYETVKRATVFAEEAAPELVEAVYRGELSYGLLQEICLVRDFDKQCEIAQWAILNGKKLIREVAPRVNEALQAHEQISLEMSLASVSATTVEQQALKELSHAHLYGVVQFYRRLVSALARGFLPKKVLTRASIANMLEALSLRSQIIKVLAPEDPLYQLARRVADTCPNCVCYPECRVGNHIQRNRRTPGLCTDKVMEWFYDQLGAEFEKESHESPERKAV